MNALLGKLVLSVGSIEEIDEGVGRGVNRGFIGAV